MKANQLLALFLGIIITMLASCQVVGDIFQTGVWVGVIGVVGIIVLVFWLLGRRKS